MCTKFEVFIFSRPRDILVELKI